MKYLATLLLIFGFGLSSFGQTIKSLGYNTTNGQIVVATNVIWTNSFNFSTNTVAASVRTNLGLGWPALTNTNESVSLIGYDANGDVPISIQGLSGYALWVDSSDTIRSDGYSVYTGRKIYFPAGIASGDSGSVTTEFDNNGIGYAGTLKIKIGAGVLNFEEAPTFTNTAATTRTNLGLGWSALTNSNAATSLLGVTTNGQIVAPTATSTLTFTNTNTIFNVVRASFLGTIGTTNLSINLDDNYLRNNSAIGAAALDWGSDAIYFGLPIQFPVGGELIQAQSRTNLGLGWSVLTNTNAATSLLGVREHQGNFVQPEYPYSVAVANIGTNYLNITNPVLIGRSWLDTSNNSSLLQIYYNGHDQLRIYDFAEDVDLLTITGDGSVQINFQDFWSSDNNRQTLGFSTNLSTLWTATNASNARSAIGIGDTNAVAFSGIYNNGNFTNNNGTIYGFKTNVGPFEGIGNFLASNNTTVSNETLFRVGLAEATNKSAQFGFRVTRTNNGGEGVAVYSVFGYNALMMIGPSDRSRTNYATNTNAGVEATLWTITPTNQVMTLRDTNTGATTLHQSLGFDTNVTSTAPADTTNIVKWIEVWVGTNSYRMPLYQ